MEIAGRKALVFGGTSGIGLATAERLAGKGAEVIAVSRNPDRAGPPSAGVSFESCDVRDEKALQALFARHAPFDILVSAATGGDRAAGPFLEMDMEKFQASFAKLWGYANVVRHGAGHMRDNGVIVLISGGPARKPRPGQIAIAAVGAAIEHFARTLARELPGHRINIVSPGIIDTPMFSTSGGERDRQLSALTAGNPVPRPGRPREIAHAILFAIENDFVTGAVIDVDGGWLVS